MRFSGAVVGVTVVCGVARAQSCSYNGECPEDSVDGMFRRLKDIQFIAALGDPEATEGENAGEWGIWRVDPGPRGVRLTDYEKLKARGGKAPAQWMFDHNDWWLEEHGLIMEKPDFPVPEGDYLVTGGRETTAVLTVKGDGTWGLVNAQTKEPTTLYTVTHLPCRSARYTPTESNAGPANANTADFPVRPGADMPAVPGCAKQDYAVVFVVGLPQE